MHKMTSYTFGYRELTCATNDVDVEILREGLFGIAYHIPSYHAAVTSMSPCDLLLLVTIYAEYPVKTVRITEKPGI